MMVISSWARLPKTGWRFRSVDGKMTVWRALGYDYWLLVWCGLGYEYWLPVWCDLAYDYWLPVCCGLAYDYWLPVWHGLGYDYWLLLSLDCRYLYHSISICLTQLLCGMIRFWVLFLIPVNHQCASPHCHPARASRAPLPSMRDSGYCFNYSHCM